MAENIMETHLVRKQSKFPKVCTSCNKKIPPGELFHLEEGVKEHIHSLLARQFCTECYTKYGERILLTGKKE